MMNTVILFLFYIHVGNTYFISSIMLVLDSSDMNMLNISKVFFFKKIEHVGTLKEHVKVC